MTIGTLPLPDGPDDVYQIYQMCYAKSVDRSVNEIMMHHDTHDGPLPVYYSLWIVRNSHRTILVDTGFGERAAKERNRPLDFDPIEGLRRIGIDPDAIEDVVLTHLHYDHAGNIDRFAKARFHIQDDEVGLATGRCMCDKLVRFTFDVEDVVNLIRRVYADRVVFHKGDDTFLPGLTLHCFPGHSAAVMGVMVNTERGQVLLASDATHYYANVLNMKPVAITLDTLATLNSYRRLMALARTPDRLIPGHDPKVTRIFPSVEVNGIALSALHLPAIDADLAELARTDNF